MDTHEFQDQAKVQRLCLTLIGEARLWYESLRPINADWVGLQNLFRQQYSKICKDSNILRYVTLGNSYFMHGDHFISMKLQKC